MISQIICYTPFTSQNVNLYENKIIVNSIFLVLHELFDAQLNHWDIDMKIRVGIVILIAGIVLLIYKY